MQRKRSQSISIISILKRQSVWWFILQFKNLRNLTFRNLKFQKFYIILNYRIFEIFLYFVYFVYFYDFVCIFKKIRENAAEFLRTHNYACKIQQHFPLFSCKFQQNAANSYNFATSFPVRRRKGSPINPYVGNAPQSGASGCSTDHQWERRRGHCSMADTTIYENVTLLNLI